jgi:hypothetical protein
LPLSPTTPGVLTLTPKVTLSLDARYPSPTLFPSVALLPNGDTGLAPKTVGTL